eukprot:SAG22_NODE_1609_length_4004_cov_7.732650_3_plen_40_part_00
MCTTTTTTQQALTRQADELTTAIQAARRKLKLHKTGGGW